MTDTYNQIRKQECEWCAKGWAICCRSESTGEFHQPPERGLHQPCTAPTKDAVIDRLAAALERARKDTERLDWLESNPEANEPSMVYHPPSDHITWRVGLEDDFETLREAIDAAMGIVAVLESKEQNAE